MQRWVSVIIVLGLMLLLFGLLMPNVEQSLQQARKSSSKYNLQQIGSAILNYHETLGSLPPGGIIRDDETAMQGWLTMILPYMDGSPDYSWLDLNESWQSPRNAYVFDQSRPVFLIPGVEQHYTTAGFGLTHYLGNPNLLYRNSSVTFGQMENGTAHTWLAGEVTGDFQPWAYPFNWRPLGTKLCDGDDGYGRPEWKGGHLLFADGSVSFFSQGIDPGILERFAAAPPVATAEQIAAPDRVFPPRGTSWDRIELQSDPQSQRNYFAFALQAENDMLLVIQVFAVEKEPDPPPKKGGSPPLLILRVESATDITAALEETSMAQDTTPAQLAANVKTLQALQKRLVKQDSAR
ncbi:hypothetical protein Pan241w_08370 [Gimesia alba]|uniref:DUF1559 domain-containing protein n=1 Tax=Gimesia alba TaxID=2527973 RepID=A0A517RA80_9PLAN|nr:DUF1559 domain-containing protein [Gimesia alba]QDT40778.1 hypothetical protein Pan241w_08370 [Gimesia alba]